MKAAENEVRDYVHAMFFFLVLVLSWVGIFALLVCELSCGTPLAPKEVCVQWERVSPEGGLEYDGNPLDGIVVVERKLDVGSE